MTIDFRPALPALIVALTGVVALVIDAFTPRAGRSRTQSVCLTGLAAALLVTFSLPVRIGCPACSPLTGGSVVSDTWSVALQALVLVVGMLALPLSTAYFRAIDQDRGEQNALIMFAIAGMLGLVSSVELISLFISLEIMSVALYALTGSRRARSDSQEAALKYFVTGAFSSAFFLYGVAWLYGVSGGTTFDRIASTLASPLGGNVGCALLASGFLLVGFGFKIAAVPFHSWAPDAYQGAPTSVTAFMSTAVKVAAFGALTRVFHGALFPLADRWIPLLAALAVLTMIVGNVSALAQRDLKRMLAYSSVAHAGYVMTALVSQPPQAAAAVFIYLVAYSVTNLGAFGVLAVLAKDGKEPLTLADISGMARRRPFLSAAMAVFLVSLTGVPLTAGFIGKLRVFAAAISADHAVLALVGLLMSAVSAYYYLRVVVAMYMEPPQDEDRWANVTGAAGLVIALCALAVLMLGVFPERLFAWAQTAAQTFR
ncbi:MAG: NADH-quinone oxidoreductase subunit N [Vicinamibacteria bacterium]|nr:NADH-quinone oxidoreductase subunit N [Vicinamibacteria bacterium]